MLPPDPFAADAPLPRVVPVLRHRTPRRPACAKCRGAGTHAEGFCLDCDGRGYRLPTDPLPLPF